MLSSVALPAASRYMLREAAGRGALAKVEEGGAAIRQPDQHESAASQVAGRRMRDGESEAHRDRGVHRVAARLQDLEPGFGGMALARDHHTVPRAHRLRAHTGRRPPQPAERYAAHSRFYYADLCVRRRFHSNSTTPAATDTLRDAILPAIGMRTSTSQCLRTCSCKPLPSPPRTNTVGAA